MTQRFLIVQLADIGDLVLSTPALDALREAHPDAHIALLTTAHAAPIVEGTGLVDEIITFDKHAFDSPPALLKPHNLRKAVALARRLRRGKYDTIIFFHHFTTRFGAHKFAALAASAGSKRRIGLENGNGYFLTERLPDDGFGAQHQAQYWLNLVGRVGASTEPRPAKIAIQPNSTLLARRETGSPPRIAIHAGSGGYSLARRWEPEKFAAVADTLKHELNAEIVLVGGKGDDTEKVKQAMHRHATDLSGKTTLPQLAGALQQCDLFIGADSGVMHVAAAAGVPVLAIFGPSNPDAWRPWTPEGFSTVVSNQPECGPCSYVGQTIGLRNGCDARTCMRTVTAGQVIGVARAMLKGTTIPSTRALPRAGLAYPNRIYILGVPVDGITYAEWLDLIGRWVQDRTGGEPRHVCTVNPEFIMIAQDDRNFFNVLNRADLCIPDGVGLLLAARYLGHPLPERVTGSDGVPRIAERAAQEGWKLFFLGAAPGVADRAAEILMARYPGLKVVGTYSGSPAPYEEDELVEQVNASGADILFVAFGAPRQDLWIARNLPHLRVKMAMGVGGSFDFIAGIVPRAPQWMQRLGLEWLFRLIRQPWRIWRMMRLPRFLLAVLLRGRG